MTQIEDKEADSHPSTEMDPEAVEMDVGGGVLLKKVNNLEKFSGGTLREKVESIIKTQSVLMFGKKSCPFCIVVKDFLTQTIGVRVSTVEIDEIPDGVEIHKYIKARAKHYTVPAVFIKGNFIGGCDTVKSLHAKNELVDLVDDLIVHSRLQGTEQLHTTQITPPDRGEAMNPLFWFPNTVNNYIVRLVGVEIFALCVLSIVFREENWGQWVSPGLLIDFTIRSTVGSGLSPLGMIAAVLVASLQPDFKPGPPKQFAASVGVVFTMTSTWCYFSGNVTVGAVILGVLASFAFLEGFFGYCFGCEVFMFGIEMGVIPNAVYRIHTSTLQESKDTWAYKTLDSNAPKPVVVDTDPNSKVALKYKKKTDEWTKDNFHLIRNMLPCYFAIPLAVAGLSLAFKIASSWSNGMRENIDESTIIVPKAWYYTTAIIAGALYCIFLILYGLRLIMYTKKCQHEWQCPWRSASFGAIPITLMVLAFLMYDEIDYDTQNGEQPPQMFARVALWIGGLVQLVMTVAKMGEWVSTRLETEHVQPQWIIMPVGLAVAALVGSIVKFFDPGNLVDEANVLIARFFLSTAQLMWIILFVVTFYTTVTGHNSDPRRRHGIFVWLAAPAVIGMAEFIVCTNESALGIGLYLVCKRNFASYYFVTIFIFFSLCWMALPHLRFFGRDPFNKGYWMDCFCLDTLACCAGLFYVLNNYQASRTMMLIGLVVCSIANLTAFLHTVVALIHRRTFFTPMDKWGPMSFFKLTHEAFRGAIPRLQKALESVDLDRPEGQRKLQEFVASFNQFVLLYTEHAKHEDEVIFKVFDEFFPGHASESSSDHERDHKIVEDLHAKALAAFVVSLPLEDRKESLADLKKSFPPFFESFLAHMRHEEDNLQPIGRKYIPLAWQKEMSQECFKLTGAVKWETLLPYIVLHLPRHMQRVRYIKSLCWFMPERSQQIGAIVYRNVDAVTWERLRIEIPEMIPRGERNWRRYW